MTVIEDVWRQAPNLVPLSVTGFDTLMPMGIVVAPDGRIRHAAPTMAKLRPGSSLTRQRFLDVFEMRRPRNVTQFADLIARGGGPLRIQFLAEPRTVLKGVGVVLPDGNGMVINLSFGIGAVDALGAYDMSSADFAATDLTVEMLYVVEANAAVQAELRRLNTRLDGARTVAEEHAHTDPLTGLRNRRALSVAFDHYGVGSEPFSVMQLDLDCFKKVNDELGHDAGDVVLGNVARILKEETRDNDTVVRAGGDEFVLIFHETTDPERLAAIASRLLRRLEAPMIYEGGEVRISASIGIAASTTFAEPDPAVLMRAADVALYRAKNSGRGCFALADETVLQGMAMPQGRTDG